MDKPTLIYCYDAYCGWCYGFSPVIKKIAAQYKNEFYIEVLSGGMMTGNEVMPIEKIAPYIKGAYKRVEELTGIQFGEDFLWHINNPDKSDWVMNSEKPAIALSVFKDYFPEDALLFATDLQYALNYEGRDLDDDEAYRHLVAKYALPKTEFFTKLQSEEYKEKAHYEFALCKHLQVTGFPQVFIQQNNAKFYLVTKGFSDYDTINTRIQNVLKEIKSTAD
jgi:putative protein-disulfide isomerase